ncbi:helix-turn-helix domain-containing protein [Lysobacter firmicutimachus]|uniref:Helix-turn-helix domain-containing protein n=1 Tax=Lysobacter firmicutimachus TaxID=1792846 RepID=A0AAU8MSX7_9GAMM|nr:helix-turn-helix domain-containing protein [Lysobacter antibioticus]
MKVSREQVGENRRRILEAAARLFRERGFEAVTVAEVMKAAGLTHGAFYGHFQSKDDLIAQALAHALAATQAPDDPAAFLAAYLSPEHCADLAGGCPTAGLAAETLRQAPQARAAMTAFLRQALRAMSASAPGANEAERRRHAIGRWSAMVGALILARSSDDPDLSAEVLAQTRAWIEARP